MNKASTLPGYSSPNVRLKHLALVLLCLLSLSYSSSAVRAEEPLAAVSYWSLDLEDPLRALCSGDVDGDGQYEILLAGQAGVVRLLEADGSIVWELELSDQVGAAMLADLDRDGKLDILLGWARGVTLLDGGGQTRWFYRTAYPIQALALEDADRNGNPAVFAATEHEHVYRLSAAGKVDWHYWPQSLGFGGTVSGLALGDLDVDGRSEVVLGFDFPGYQSVPPGGHVLVLDDEGTERWRRREITPVTAVATIDVDGWGKKLIASGTAEGDLLILFGDGTVRWQRELGSEIIRIIGADVDDDERDEIVVVARDSALVLDDDGTDLWSLGGPLHAVAATLGVLEGAAGRPLAILTWRPSLHRATADLIDARGSVIESYVLPRSTPQGAAPSGSGSQGRLAALSDLNQDGWPDLLVATDEALYLLARARGAAQTRLAWRFRTRGEVSVLHSFASEPGSGSRVLLSSEDGSLYLLDGAGSLAWRHATAGRIRALASGDLDGDGEADIALAYNQPGERDEPLRSGITALRADGRVLWTRELGQYVWSLLAAELDGAAPAEVVAATGSGGIVALKGDQLVWSARLGGAALAMQSADVGVHDGLAEVWIGASDGYAYLLSGTGRELWKVYLGSAVSVVGCVDLDGDGGVELLAASESGALVALTSEGVELWRYTLGGSPLGLAAGDFEGKGRLSLLCATANGSLHSIDAMGGSRWRYTILSRLMALEAGDVDGDGRIEAVAASVDGVVYVVGDGGVPEARHDLGSPITTLEVRDVDGDERCDVLAGTRDGALELYRWAPNRPPLVCNPAVTRSDAGYIYSVSVLDPENDRVQVNLRVQDPFSGQWQQSGSRYALASGSLHWFVEPFPLLASGRMAAFSLAYDDGVNSGSLGVVAGPRLPGFPWYVYGAVLLLAGISLYSYRSWRESPVRDARRLYAELASNPHSLLEGVRALARPGSTESLIRLSQRAREAGDRAIASLAEGYLLLPSRPIAGLEVIAAALGDLTAGRSADDSSVTDLISFYELLSSLLGASTLGRILMQRSRLERFLRTTAPGPPDGARAASSSDLSLPQRRREGVKGPSPSELTSQPAQLPELRQALAQLQRVTGLLQASERAVAADDKLDLLAQASQTLASVGSLSGSPEGQVVERIVTGWQKVVGLLREEWLGRAQLRCRLRTRRIVAASDTTLLLEIQNRGRCAALRTSVELSRDTADYVPLDPPVPLGDIAPGQTRQAELALRPATGGLDGFRVQFVLRYSDQDARDQTQLFADQVQVLEPADFRPIVNPYVPGRPLGPASPVFYGRDEVYEFIAENARGLQQRNILILIGQRRTGKTSMLLQLPLRLDSSIIPVYLDCQSLGLTPGLASWLADVAATLGDALAERGIQVTVPDAESLRDQPARVFERRFLGEVQGALGEKTLLLVFDEFEELETRVKSGRLEPTLFPYLRHLMQHSQKLTFAFVGTHRLEEMSGDYWSVLFNIALYRHIGYLDEEASIKLATEPVRPHGMIYDDLALHRIWQVTAGHPYFLQILCYALVQAHNRNERSYTTVSDVDAALEDILTLGSAHFSFLWESSTEVERAVLLALTQLLARLGQARWPLPGATPGDVLTLLADRGLALNVSSVAAALRSLTDREILRGAAADAAGSGPGSGERYVFRVGLVALWVERFKSLSRVIEEMAQGKS